MLTIRTEQQRALESDVTMRFIRDMAASARVRLPGCCAALSPDALAALVEAGLARATTFGIEERDDLVAFLDLVVAHGADFDRLPAFDWAADLLTDDSLPGDVKIAFVYERLPRRLHPSTLSLAGAVK
jgi:hypothetical protein